MKKTKRGPFYETPCIFMTMIPLWYYDRTTWMFIPPWFATTGTVWLLHVHYNLGL